MSLSFRERKRLGRFHRKVREAERRVNSAIIRRIQEIKVNPDQIKQIDTLVDDDVKHMQKGMKEHIQRILASLGGKKEPSIVAAE